MQLWVWYLQPLLSAADTASGSIMSPPSSSRVSSAADSFLLILCLWYLFGAQLNNHVHVCLPAMQEETIIDNICWTPARLGRRARREMNADPFNFAIMVRLHLEKSSGKNISTVWWFVWLDTLREDCYYLQLDGEGTVHSVYTREEIV